MQFLQGWSDYVLDLSSSLCMTLTGFWTLSLPLLILRLYKVPAKNIYGGFSPDIYAKREKTVQHLGTPRGLQPLVWSSLLAALWGLSNAQLLG